jgi:hypothetical protein
MALRGLGRRAGLPVQLDVDVPHRLPDPVEVATYYVVSEALTNAAKHARASMVRVHVRAVDEAVDLAISDDGIGGAHPDHGSGLVGLTDRVEALGGVDRGRQPARRWHHPPGDYPVRPERDWSRSPVGRAATGHQARCPGVGAGAGLGGRIRCHGRSLRCRRPAGSPSKHNEVVAGRGDLRTGALVVIVMRFRPVARERRGGSSALWDSHRPPNRVDLRPHRLRQSSRFTP